METAGAIIGASVVLLAALFGLLFFFNIPANSQRWLDEQLDKELRKDPDQQ